MAACPRCGVENSERARFCQNCGASLSPTEQPREERKLVSVLFVDSASLLGSSRVREILKARP